MKRLQLSQVLVKRDTKHRKALEAEMRTRLKGAAIKKGLKPGVITFSEHYEEMDGGAFTLLIIDAQMDIP